MPEKPDLQVIQNQCFDTKKANKESMDPGGRGAFFVTVSRFHGKEGGGVPPMQGTGIRDQEKPGALVTAHISILRL
jgi:hypothetical protein